MINTVTAMIKPVAENTIYRLAGLGGILAGTTITPKLENSARDEPKTHSWSLRSGIFTPRQIVEGFAPLLDTVVYRLGQDAPNTKPARALLLENIASNLATHTRESTLVFQQDVPDISRREIKEQADRIGKALVKWAQEASSGPFEPDLNIRSPCENHLLTPINVDLMFGTRSQPHLMQLFNEYMHQMVLLRDALLPFRNFDEVLIPVDGESARGLRYMEPARAQFLTTFFIKSVTQTSVMSYAKALLAPDLPKTKTGGYGFQYEHGSIIPAVLGGGETSFHLMEYIPARIDPLMKEILFDYEFSDYFEAPRLEIPVGSQVLVEDLLKFPSELAFPLVQNASLDIMRSTSSIPVRQLELCLELDNGKCVSVDVGQIARGHRYAYQALDSEEETDFRVSTKVPIFHSALDILLNDESGLITANQGGVHVIPTVDPVIALAVLGKLYPENVVLLPEGEGLSQTEKAGKGFEPKFVIWGGVRRGGLKGYF